MTINRGIDALTTLIAWLAFRFVDWWTSRREQQARKRGSAPEQPVEQKISEQAVESELPEQESQEEAAEQKLPEQSAESESPETAVLHEKEKVIAEKEQTVQPEPEEPSTAVKAATIEETTLVGELPASEVEVQHDETVKLQSKSSEATVAASGAAASAVLKAEGGNTPSSEATTNNEQPEKPAAVKKRPVKKASTKKAPVKKRVTKKSVSKKKTTVKKKTAPKKTLRKQAGADGAANSVVKPATKSKKATDSKSKRRGIRLKKDFGDDFDL
jgi:hypothetical protein